MNNDDDKVWALFDTDLTPIPKNSKKNLTVLKSWRAISIGTSVNWILEKIFFARLLPFLGVSNFRDEPDQPFSDTGLSGPGKDPA